MTCTSIMTAHPSHWYSGVPHSFENLRVILKQFYDDQSKYVIESTSKIDEAGYIQQETIKVFNKTKAGKKVNLIIPWICILQHQD